jgi:hypothetical protein
MHGFLTRRGGLALTAVLLGCCAIAWAVANSASTDSKQGLSSGWPGHLRPHPGDWLSLLRIATPELVSGVSASSSSAAPVAAASGSPLAATASDIVLSPADVGPDFVLASSGEAVRFGVSARVQSLVRGGKHVHNIEPDGILYVRSFAQVAPDPGAADQLFDQFGKGLLESGIQEVAPPPIGDRARAAVAWGQGPFDPAVRVVVFRLGAALGWVVVGSYEAPEQIDEVVLLAQKMAARAAR